MLSERCSELIELFDEKTTQQSQALITTANDQLHSSTSVNISENKVIDASTPPNSSYPKSKHTNSKFLDRTLTFNNFMTSSALLSSTLDRSSHSLQTSNSEPNSSFYSIKNFVFKLSQNEKGLFGQSLNEFISCTNNSKELNPNVLMSNTRQFMDGIKNYLLKNEVNSELKGLIEKERANLDLNQLLNVDSIIEDCLQSIILRPLKAKIYYLIVDWLIKDSSLIQISKSMKTLNSLNENECVKYLCLSKAEHQPNKETLDVVKCYYSRMQCEYAPLIKLKYLLLIVNELLASIGDFEMALSDLAGLNVVEFLPVVIYALSKCNMYAIQIELDYIWCLANKKLLTSETVYYLTLMSSACFVIKTLDKVVLKESCMAKAFMSSGLMDVYFLDEKYQTIRLQTIPVKPSSKCRDVNSLIASKFKIFNLNEYGLYYVENGVEKRIRDEEIIKNGSNMKFIFKQKNFNILWPKSIESF